MLSQSINRKGLILYYDFTEKEYKQISDKAEAICEAGHKVNVGKGYAFFDGLESHIFTDYEVVNA